MARDDFPVRTKEALAKRVNYLCSNPRCTKATSGPHSDPTKALNIGVAAHITAAAPGGPRYDPTATAQDREAFQNGIWLCQSCAKLVDNDPEFFTAELLQRWKAEAEARALAALSGRTLDDLPQPPGSKHVPLPRIRWLPYDQARAHLVDHGWHPILRHWADSQDPDITLGNGPYYWQKGFREIAQAGGTGTAACVFAFEDAYGHRLEVCTEGEADPDVGSEAIVMSWRIQDAAHPLIQLQPPASSGRAAIQIERRPTPKNLLDSSEVGTPREKLRERLGTPDLMSGNTWQYRFRETQVDVEFAGECVHSVVIALVDGYLHHGEDAPFGDYVLGELTVQGLFDMGHKHVVHRSSLRTNEVIVPVRVGPAGAWSECFFGALVVHSGAGSLAETTFEWDDENDQLKSSPAQTVLNWVGIGGSFDEPPYFYWFIKS